MSGLFYLIAATLPLGPSGQLAAIPIGAAATTIALCLLPLIRPSRPA